MAKQMPASITTAQFTARAAKVDFIVAADAGIAAQDWGNERKSAAFDVLVSTTRQYLAKPSKNGDRKVLEQGGAAIAHIAAAVHQADAAAATAKAHKAAEQVAAGQPTSAERAEAGAPVFTGESLADIVSREVEAN